MIYRYAITVAMVFSGMESPGRMIMKAPSYKGHIEV